MADGRVRADVQLEDSRETKDGANTGRQVHRFHCKTLNAFKRAIFAGVGEIRPGIHDNDAPQSIDGHRSTRTMIHTCGGKAGVHRGHGVNSD
jgi:hypothetical protein